MEYKLNSDEITTSYKHIDMPDSHFGAPVNWLYHIGMFTLICGFIYGFIQAFPPQNREKAFHGVYIFLTGFLIILFTAILNKYLGTKCPICRTKTRTVNEIAIIHYYCDKCKIHMHMANPRVD